MDARAQAGDGGPLGGGDAQGLEAARARAEAQGIIRGVHDYCWSRCSNRDHCPGDACRLYRKEQAAKDTLQRLDAEARVAIVESVPTDAFGNPVIR